VSLFEDAHPLEGPSASLERLGDGIDSVYEIHEPSVY